MREVFQATFAFQKKNILIKDKVLNFFIFVITLEGHV